VAFNRRSQSTQDWRKRRRGDPDAPKLKHCSECGAVLKGKITKSVGLCWEHFVGTEKFKQYDAERHRKYYKQNNQQ
jgi:hypothetical protein